MSENLNLELKIVPEFDTPEIREQIKAHSIDYEEFFLIKSAVAVLINQCQKKFFDSLEEKNKIQIHNTEFAYQM